MTVRPVAELAAEVREALPHVVEGSWMWSEDELPRKHIKDCPGCAIEPLVAELAQRAETAEAERERYRIEGDHGHDDYEDAEHVIRQIAEARVNKPFDPWARGLCQEFLDRPRRSRATIAAIRERAETAERALREILRLATAQRDHVYTDHNAIEEIVRVVKPEFDIERWIDPVLDYRRGRVVGHEPGQEEA